MIWTLVIFGITFYLLKRLAFGRIAEHRGRRRVVRENLEAAEKARDEAQRLLEEYRKQLADARQEASQIVERAHRTGEEERRRMHDELQAERERGVPAAKSAIEVHEVVAEWVCYFASPMTLRSLEPQRLPHRHHLRETQ